MNLAPLDFSRQAASFEPKFSKIKKKIFANFAKNFILQEAKGQILAEGWTNPEK
jgi:hypothetical protein